MGDSSDNIPGCKGVGEKTAVGLIQQFGSVENMLQRTDEIKGALRTKVETQQEEIRFSKFLATIRRDVPVALDEEALLRKDDNVEALNALYRQLEFRSLMITVESQKSRQSLKAENPITTSGRTAKSKPADSGLLDLFGDLFAEPAEAAPAVTYTTDKGQGETAAEAAQIAHYLLQPEMKHDIGYLEDIYNARGEELQKKIEDELRKDERLWHLYTDVELPLAPILRKMEKAGVRFDKAILAEASEQMHKELDNLENDIKKEVTDSGVPDSENFNPSSPKQVGELLFDVLKLDPKAKKTKSGQYVTSEEVLQTLRDRHPVVGKILDYRELKKLLSTYIDALPSLIDPSDGKIHTTYNQTVTATGRLSSSNPTLQNLPIRSERGQLIRRAVVPDAGCVFLSADYSQIELRLMAHLSGDEHMTAAFNAGEDIHAATAAKIFAKPIGEVTREQRRRAKTANFGIIYGISAFGLSQQLECSRQEAKELIDGYFAAFPGVMRYIEEQKQRVRQTGYAETLFGRKRYLPDIYSQNATVRSFAERNAVNAPIQGTAADIIKIAMVNIDRRLTEEGLQAQMIMQVHDELNFNVPVAEAEAVKKIVVEEMQNVVSLRVPLLAECGIGANWLEAH